MRQLVAPFNQHILRGPDAFCLLTEHAAGYHQADRPQQDTGERVTHIGIVLGFQLVDLLVPLIELPAFFQCVLMGNPFFKVLQQASHARF
ncbi:hypothetical protein D3C79_959420 [compost metagenome]